MNTCMLYNDEWRKINVEAELIGRRLSEMLSIKDIYDMNSCETEISCNNAGDFLLLKNSIYLVWSFSKYIHRLAYKYTVVYKCYGLNIWLANYVTRIIYTTFCLYCRITSLMTDDR